MPHETSLLDTLIKLAELLVTILSAIVVAWYWNWQRDTLERYRYLDESYTDLLRLYLENPRFGNPALTDDYGSQFKDDEGIKYHYFAMTVHTVMETLFDLSKGRIRREWRKIFNYHTKLHVAWLAQNRDVQENAYVKRVFSLTKQDAPLDRAATGGPGRG